MYTIFIVTCQESKFQISQKLKYMILRGRKTIKSLLSLYPYSFIKIFLFKFKTQILLYVNIIFW
jgi:hypothetical protein